MPVGRWRARLLRATLPIGLVLLVGWLVWIGMPFVMGAQRSDVTVAQAVVGLVTSLVLVITGYGYRRAMPPARSREAMAYEAGRPHPFIAVHDDGLAAFAGGSAFARTPAPNVSAVATTNRYLRMEGCAVPGCGKPRDAEVHAPEDA
jgi:hypothetical protein